MNNTPGVANEDRQYDGVEDEFDLGKLVGSFARESCAHGVLRTINQEVRVG